ncbi:MAG: N-acetylglutamate synthase-like GNAT family acetyltransferase [Halioglobus sp.]
MVDGYKISEDLSEIDLKAVHGYLSNAYWSKGIPFEKMYEALQNSLCFGILTESGSQIGFARMITDKATFAYLADVFILQDHRGKGLSKWLMEAILSHRDLQGLRRMMLATKDAHGLYKKFGFEALENPEKLMELLNLNVYQTGD